MTGRNNGNIDFNGCCICVRGGCECVCICKHSVHEWEGDQRTGESRASKKKKMNCAKLFMVRKPSQPNYLSLYATPLHPCNAWQPRRDRAAVGAFRSDLLYGGFFNVLIRKATGAAAERPQWGAESNVVKRPLHTDLLCFPWMLFAGLRPCLISLLPHYHIVYIGSHPKKI